MPSLPEEANLWLNSRPDSGVRIREDVCAAAEKIWRRACQKTTSALGDSSDTAALLELAAEEASIYLDGQDSSANVPAVLWTIFCRLLSKYTVRFRRLEPAGSAIEWQTSVPSWEDSVINQLFFEKLKRYLSQDGVRILSKRWQGYDWDDLASLFGLPVAVLRGRFWREIANAKVKLGITAENNGHRPAKGKKKRDSAA